MRRRLRHIGHWTRRLVRFQFEDPGPDEAVVAPQPHATAAQVRGTLYQAGPAQIPKRTLDATRGGQPQGRREILLTEEAVAAGNRDHDGQAVLLPEQDTRELGEAFSVGARHPSTVRGTRYAYHVS